MDRVYDLQCEYKKNPRQLDVEKPRFSWKIKADGKDITQIGWELKIWDQISGEIIWNTSEKSNRTVHIIYEGPKLQENKSYRWEVKSELNDGRFLISREIAFFETGLWDQDFWKGIWIGKRNREDLGVCPYFRKKVNLKDSCDRARVFISACGLYELSVNGITQSEYKLTPGWTNYKHHIQYLAYDITKYLSAGENVIGVRLGDGWYDGEISFNHQTHVYGTEISFAAILILEQGQERTIITTDQTWMAQDSGIISSSIYNGEIYDLTQEAENWNQPGYDDGSWEPAVCMEDPGTDLRAMINEGTKEVDTITPVEILHTPNGGTLIDMGQNMTGWVRITLDAKKGDRVHIKHGEILDREGNFYSGNLRLAKQEEQYTLRQGQNILEPHFTFHGFRYIKILEFPVEVRPEYFEGVVLHTAMAPTIRFESSNQLVNQLQHNLVWGQKGNFLDVPTDCPQRDERLGWTGDAQIFAQTACYNFAVDAFFAKWLEDVKADQYLSGAIPFVVPDVLPKDWGPLEMANLGSEHTSAAWADAITISPWTLYLSYGDVRILEQTYDHMKRYISYIYDGAGNGSGNPYLWDWGPQLGDWLALDSEPGSYGGATDETFIATAYYAYSVKIVSKCASILNHSKEQQQYLELYEKIRQNFTETYLSNGRINIQTQTAQLVPLYFELLDGVQARTAVETLVQLLHENGDHLTTGFVGTPYLCHVLSRYGHNEMAYTLLLQEDFPSWLYQVKQGATTIWEHWDGCKPDGTFWSDDMNSFNHYAYGSIGEWLYRCAAGINPDEADSGFSHIIIQPRTSSKITNLSCTFDSIRGEIKSSWERNENQVHYHVEIPANTRASLFLENGAKYEVGSGSYNYNIVIDG